MKSKTAAAAEVLEVASKYIGHRSMAMRQNGFNAKTGTAGQPWAGSFLEVCIREAGYNAGVSLVNTLTAYAEFARTHNFLDRPQVGNIVFYRFGVEPFGMPHVGIVADASRWKNESRILAIEGETGKHLDSDIRDGVYERVRHASEIMAFVRPDFRPLNTEPLNEKLPLVMLEDLPLGKDSDATVLVQYALNKTTGEQDFAQGVFDFKTKAAYAQWQRRIGYTGPKANGVPDVPSLRALARETGYFRV